MVKTDIPTEELLDAQTADNACVYELKPSELNRINGVSRMLLKGFGVGVCQGFCRCLTIRHIVGEVRRRKMTKLSQSGEVYKVLRGF
jgi:hypothetical protein